MEQSKNLSGVLRDIKKRVSAFEAATRYGLPMNGKAAHCIHGKRDTNPSMTFRQGDGICMCWACGGKPVSCIDIYMHQTGETNLLRVAQQLDLDFGLNMRLSDKHSNLTYTPLPDRSFAKTVHDRLREAREELNSWLRKKRDLEETFTDGVPTDEQLDKMDEILENLGRCNATIGFLENGFLPSAYDYRETDEWKKMTSHEKMEALKERRK